MYKERDDRPQHRNNNTNPSEYLAITIKHFSGFCSKVIVKVINYTNATDDASVLVRLFTFGNL